MKPSIVIIVDKNTSELLLQSVCGQPLVNWFVRRLAASCPHLVFALDLSDDQLREHLRTLAIRLPIRLHTLNLDPHFAAYDSLRPHASQFGERFILVDSCFWNTPFIYQQMCHSSAPLCLAAGEPQLTLSHPPRWLTIHHQLATAVSLQPEGQSASFAGHYLLTGAHLQNWAAPVGDQNAWTAAWQEWCQTTAVATVTFAGRLDKQQITPDNFAMISRAILG
ncbi:hypothetical protein IJJ12_01090, partial [bacterium]|nr:hypothetical protein [bacterium]